ncbi:MAG TPA: hypothetical protein VHB73_04565 [Alphaproteobacteria bacterium]|nr:hypothetical protein [Alphaproteobacteria bacterium]
MSIHNLTDLRRRRDANTNVPDAARMDDKTVDAIMRLVDLHEQAGNLIPARDLCGEVVRERGHQHPAASKRRLLVQEIDHPRPPKRRPPPAFIPTLVMDR